MKVGGRGNNNAQMALVTALTLKKFARIKRKLSLACLKQSTVIDEGLSWHSYFDSI